MNILLYDLTSYIQNDVIYYLKKMGHKCRNILYKMPNTYEDDFFEYKFKKIMKEDSYDCVISTNFIPLLARICYEANMKYISWIYDSPVNYDNIETFQYPTSYIFLFDRIDAEKITAAGGVHVYHLPLAVNTNRLDQIKITPKDTAKYGADISFIGMFYDNQLNTIRYCLSDYDKGYLDSIVQSQLQLYGCNIIEPMITDDFVQKINNSLQSHTTTKLTAKQIIYCISQQVTHIERTTLCHMLGLEHTLKYYSSAKLTGKDHITWMGTAHYFSEMPVIFKSSKLNLNPTLKSIQSGIPLRALDILGSKSVLLSNYQPELAEYFVDGQDVIMYESIEDAIAKADYYLEHKDLLKEIADNGYRIVREHFNYPDKIQYMLETAGL